MRKPSNSNICEQITPLELAAHSEKKAVLLDVRSPLEFETEHVADSINIPLGELEKRCEELPRSGELIVICRSGKRAERGAYILLGRGFQPKILAGGLLAWRKAVLPLNEGKKMLPIERQVQLIVGIGLLTSVVLTIFVNLWFLLIPAFFGAGLTFAGLSGTCGLGILLMKAPWNQLPQLGRENVAVGAKPEGGCCR